MSTVEKSPDEKSPDESPSWLDELTGPPTWLQLESVIPMAEVRKITSLSDEALENSHSDRIRRLSERRKGMKLRDVLAIANGESITNGE